MKFVLVFSLLCTISNLALASEAPTSFDSKIKSITATEETVVVKFETLDEAGLPRTIKISGNKFKDVYRLNTFSLPVLISAYQSNTVVHVDYKADENMGRIMGYYPVITLSK